MKNAKLLSWALVASILLAPCSVFAGPTDDKKDTQKKEQKHIEEKVRKDSGAETKKSPNAGSRKTPRTQGVKRTSPEDTKASSDFSTVDSLIEPTKKTTEPSRKEPCAERTGGEEKVSFSKTPSDFSTVDSLLESSGTSSTPSCEEPTAKHTRYENPALAVIPSPVPYSNAINDWLVDVVLPKISTYPEQYRYDLFLYTAKCTASGKYALKPETYEFLLIRAANMFFEDKIRIPDYILKLIPPSELQTLRSFPFPRDLLSKQTFDNTMLGRIFDRPPGWKPEIDSLPTSKDVNTFLFNHPANKLFQSHIRNHKLANFYGKTAAESTVYLNALRIWFMEGYRQGVFSVPQWIIDLKHREDEENARLAPTVDFKTLWSSGLQHSNPGQPKTPVSQARIFWVKNS